MSFIVLRALALLLAVTFAWPAQADYVEIRRATTVKSKPDIDADILSKPAVGSTFDLLDGGKQTNGYYHVVDPSGGESGWVYRTFVRRYAGRLATASPVPPSAATGLPRPEGDTMKVHYIDVGQGNAALVEFSCGAVLIDAGGENDESTTALMKYLDDFFVRRTDLNKTLNAIFVTHTHIDHNRALQSVVEKFTVPNYVHNGVHRGSGRHAAAWMRDHANDNGRRIAMREVTHDDVARITDKKGVTDEVIDPVNCSGVDPKLRVLYGPFEDNPGWTEDAFDNGNNQGIVLRIDFGAASFLFPGDIEDEAIEELVAFYRGTEMLNVDVYLVGHHGSHNGTTQSYISAMSPEMAVISMGRPTQHKAWTAWAYGHPREVVVKMLGTSITRSRGAAIDAPVGTGAKKFVNARVSRAIYATGWDGTVVVEADKSGRLLATANDNRPLRVASGSGAPR